MNFFLIVAFIAGVIWLVFRILNAQKQIEIEWPISIQSTPVPEPGYRVRWSVMNKSEQAFFYELQRQLPSGYYIFPNMRIADIIDPVEGAGFRYRLNKIMPKHIDFLVCDHSFKPIVAIEVNGSSHQRPDRIQRDELVRKIFASAQLPLEFVDVGTSFEQSVAGIKSFLRGSSNQEINNPQNDQSA